MSKSKFKFLSKKHNSSQIPDEEADSPKGVEMSLVSKVVSIIIAD